MFPNSGAVVAVGLLSLTSYLFWRGTVVVMNAHRAVRMGARLIDAGTPEEFLLAHIAGAVNFPRVELERRQDEIGPHGFPLVIYAQSGVQSARAAHVLRSIGYRSVINAGSMARWTAVHSG
jgi:rhodanese-related sulfurtransferase